MHPRLLTYLTTSRASGETSADGEHDGLSDARVRVTSCASCVSLGMPPTCIPIAPRRSTLAISIGHVVGIRAEEQVMHVDARRVVAAVENVETRWDRTYLVLPCPAVRAAHSPANTPSPVAAFVASPRRLKAAS